MTAQAFVRVAVAGGLFAAVAAMTTVAGTEPTSTAQQGGDEIQPNVGGCRRCHFNGPQASDAEASKFILLNESRTWFERDPHSLAYKQILADKNPLAARMQKVLEQSRAGYKNENDPACLACHATDLKPQSTGPRTVADYARLEDVGVGCAGCHGLKSKWQTDHFNLPAYRTMTPAAKEASGMHDLRNPHVKAALCVSCHVGNPAQGKVITHEMYAAGHPPLPPIELLMFLDAEPRHWGTVSELPYLRDLAKADAKKAWDLFHARDEAVESSAARHVAVGAIAALKAEMATVAAGMNVAGPGGLPDFARFDCYACHHDLVIPSARQEGGYAGPPGRPPLKAWVAAVPAVVVKHAAAHSDPGVKAAASGFDTAWQAVIDASLAQPFGDRAKLAAAATALATWCDGFQKAVDAAVVYSPAEAGKLAAALKQAAVDPKVLRDPEAVAQVTWAVAALDGYGGKPDPARRKAIVALSPIPLPDREKATGTTPVTVGSFLAERTKAFREFDPKAFVEKFGTATGPK